MVLSRARNAQDLEYSTWVDEVGSGRVDNDAHEIEIPHSLIQPLHTFKELQEYLFPADVLAVPTATMTCAFLSPLNRLIDDINTFMLEQLDGDEGSSSLPLSPPYNKDRPLVISLHSYYMTLLTAPSLHCASSFTKGLKQK